MLNLGNSLFPGLNDQGGIMICGYEWGDSLADQRRAALEKAPDVNPNAITTFSNKTAAHGAVALSWPYDNRIIKWFGLWGHPLSRQGIGGPFEQCLIQTNWCDTQGHKIEGSIRNKLHDPMQVSNFIHHIDKLKPSLILFMGSAMIDALQSQKVLKPFVGVVGCQTRPIQKVQKAFSGRRFRIGFQSFERCDVVSLPHPSSSRGLSDDYISLFTDEIGARIAGFKKAKGV